VTDRPIELEAQHAFDHARVKLVSLTDYSILLDQALRSGYINEKEMPLLNDWRQDPADWDSAVKA
jgi:orotate phosphoribosyltransferase